MQEIWDHYTNAQKPTKEEAAVDEIMDALGLTAEEPEGTAAGDATEPEPEECGEQGNRQEENRAQETEPEPEAAADGPAARLHRLNRAIDALSGLYESDVGALADDLVRIACELRAYRARAFEKHVDWEAVARGIKYEPE